MSFLPKLNDIKTSHYIVELNLGIYNLFCLILPLNLGIHNVYRPWDDLHQPNERDEGALWIYARSGD